MPGQRLEVAAFGATGDAVGPRRSLLRFFERLNAGDLGAFDLFADDFVHNRPLPGIAGHSTDSARAGFLALRSAIPDLQIAVEHMIVEGSFAGVRIVQSGTCEAPLFGVSTAEGPFSMSATLIFRFRGEQIAEEWVQYDSDDPGAR